MKSVELKVARIGNSRGVRLPATTLERYQIGASVVMEERSDGILLRPPGPAKPKLSWEETAQEMAQVAEDWSEWESTSADGMKESYPRAHQLPLVGTVAAGLPIEAIETRESIGRSSCSSVSRFTSP